MEDCHTYFVGRFFGASPFGAHNDGCPVQLVNGRAPINSSYAGQSYPLENLPANLQAKYADSVQFKANGHPDFSPYAQVEVEVSGLTGDYAADAAMANGAAGLAETPADFVWHHVEDAFTRQLVPKDIHAAVRHTGGAAILRRPGRRLASKS